MFTVSWNQDNSGGAKRRFRPPPLEHSHGSYASSPVRFTESTFFQAWSLERAKILTAGPKSLHANFASFYVPGQRVPTWVAMLKKKGLCQGLIRTVRMNQIKIKSFPDESWIRPTLEHSRAYDPSKYDIFKQIHTNSQAFWSVLRATKWVTSSARHIKRLIFYPAQTSRVFWVGYFPRRGISRNRTKSVPKT